VSCTPSSSSSVRTRSVTRIQELVGVTSHPITELIGFREQPVSDPNVLVGVSQRLDEAGTTVSDPSISVGVSQRLDEAGTGEDVSVDHLSMRDKEDEGNMITEEGYVSDNDSLSSTDSEPINPRFCSLDDVYTDTVCMSLGLPELSVDSYIVDSHAYNILSTKPRVRQEPITYEEALKFEDAKEWKIAMDKEYNALLENKTWELVRLPQGRSTVKCKWVYKIKYLPSGEIERYKARLVAKGFSQKEGIDYTEIYAPVIRHDSVRTMLAIAAAHKMYKIQFDIGTAFLNAKLDEEIFMEQPMGYRKAGGLVCKLKKSLYRLKQATRKWNEKFDSFLKKYDLLVSNADSCVYYNPGKIKTIIGIYVDDRMACFVDKTELDKIIKHLETKFDVKTGVVDYYVGFQIKTSDTRDRVFINQSRYILDIIDRFGMSDCHLVDTPADPKTLFNDSQGEFDYEIGLDEPYKEAVGSLMYTSIISRPDISFAVGDVTRYSKNPRRSHWMAIKRIFRYLKGTITHGILYCGKEEDMILKGFCDADFANNTKNRKSRSGYVFLLGQGAIAWCSMKQPVIAQSMTDRN
jgi:hypothetical protein